MELMGIKVNTTACDKHVPEVERYNRTIKDWIRAMTHKIPFKQLPHQLIVEIAYNAVFWLNCHKNGIHMTLSLCTIVTGLTIDFNKHCKLPFGKYMQNAWTTQQFIIAKDSRAIVLGATGNAQGCYYFLSLRTGKEWSETTGQYCLCWQR